MRFISFKTRSFYHFISFKTRSFFKFLVKILKKIPGIPTPPYMKRYFSSDLDEPQELTQIFQKPRKSAKVWHAREFKLRSGYQMKTQKGQYIKTMTIYLSLLDKPGSNQKATP